jgi:methyl-accepting chemotaxis protein
VENKFINNETLGYLRSQTGTDTQAQIAALQAQNAELVSYLQDFQKYYDYQLTEGGKAIIQVSERTESTADRVTEVNALMNDLTSALRDYTNRTAKLAIFSLAVSCFALGVGLFLCLVK